MLCGRVRGCDQAFTLGVFAQADEHLADQLLEGGAGEGRGSIKASWCSVTNWHSSELSDLIRFFRRIRTNSSSFLPAAPFLDVPD